LKILIISDTHGNWKNIEQVEKREKPDKVFFLGDGAEDTLVLNQKCIGVLGNCDFSSKLFNDQECIEIAGKKVLLTHGHYYGVKRGLGEVVAFALREKIDIVCHGHTHIQNLEHQGGVTIFNPGSLWSGEYGVLEIQGEIFKFLCKKL